LFRPKGRNNHTHYAISFFCRSFFAPQGEK
jgi:hypothetical protein